MLRMSMGNRLLVPGPVPAVSAAAADDCCAAMDTGTSATTAPPDESTEPEPAALPARNSFEIMNQFNWDMVDIPRCRLRFFTLAASCGKRDVTVASVRLSVRPVVYSP